MEGRSLLYKRQEISSNDGIQHRLSSVSLPSSNSRAELAVKMSKRLLMDNAGPNGDLDNNKIVHALLTQRNTPDPGCKLSPAQILKITERYNAIYRQRCDVFNNP